MSQSIKRASGKFCQLTAKSAKVRSKKGQALASIWNLVRQFKATNAEIIPSF